MKAVSTGLLYGMVSIKLLPLNKRPRGLATGSFITFNLLSTIYKERNYRCTILHVLSLRPNIQLPPHD